MHDHHVDHDHLREPAHDHSHGHGRAPAATADRRLKLALALTAGFMLVEVIGGIFSGSLALLADAGHMLTDVLALALALWARHQTLRPADAQRSYGYHRLPVLAAFVNGLALLAIIVWIGIEAVQRLLTPPPVAGELMLGVAAAGLLVNIAAFFVLRGARHDHDHAHDLNLRGALLHVLGDLLGSAAAIVAAVVILVTGWMPIDPLLSLLVAALILRSAWRLVRESAHVLLEGTPEGFDAAQFADRLVADVAGVRGVHHVHHWMLTPERSLMTLHAELADAVDDDRVVREIKAWVKSHYRVAHVTVQTERGGCADEHPH
ncbi:cation diffusion facilitator family transporter [Sinimarinibacterium thermocellulolyticum]|uniref:Cation diffusion facilitator family transporter n=1 Tax=Sinimarinibacterium thermocellulolyticum TaxID=3170016 RepID=A0ABV2A834_9GAMM